MEAGFSKSSLINIIDNPTDKEIIRGLCLATLAKGKEHIPELMIGSAYNSRKPSLLNYTKISFKNIYFLVKKYIFLSCMDFIQHRLSPAFSFVWSEMPPLAVSTIYIRHVDKILLTWRDSEVFTKFGTRVLCWTHFPQIFKSKLLENAKTIQYVLQ